MLNAANTTVQLSIAPAMRGRVMALYMMLVMGGTPLGAPIVGWVGATFGARWTLIGGGAMSVLGVLLAVAALPRAARRPPARAACGPCRRGRAETRAGGLNARRAPRLPTMHPRYRRLVITGALVGAVLLVVLRAAQVLHRCPSRSRRPRAASRDLVADDQALVRALGSGRRAGGAAPLAPGRAAPRRPQGPAGTCRSPGTTTPRRTPANHRDPGAPCSTSCSPSRSATGTSRPDRRPSSCG